MIDTAVLLAGSERRESERLGGVTVFERQIFSLARAGIRVVFLAGGGFPAPGSFRKPKELELVRRDKERELEAAQLLVSGDHFFRVEALRAAASGPGGKVEPVEGAAIDLRTASRQEIRSWLLEGVRKDSDGFMARYFDRRISLAVTRRL